RVLVFTVACQPDRSVADRSGSSFSRPGRLTMFNTLFVSARRPARVLLGVGAIAIACASSPHPELTPPENALLAPTAGNRALAMRRHLSQEVVTTPTGAGKGTAVAGSPEEKALADAIERELRGAGLAVRQERFPVRHYRYGTVTLTGNGQPIEAISLH